MRLRLRSAVYVRVFGLLLIWLLTAPLFAVSLEDLRNDPKLTPQRFASYFSNFRFEFHADVQDSKVFLATQSGDCDDYAILASEVLKTKGYTPHLIAIRMHGVVHVVCYIDEVHAYLDYNVRNCLSRTVSSDGTIPDIARKVANSFDSAWTTASEFTFEDGSKRLVTTSVHRELFANALRRTTILSKLTTASN